MLAKAASGSSVKVVPLSTKAPGRDTGKCSFRIKLATRISLVEREKTGGEREQGKKGRKHFL